MIPVLLYAIGLVWLCFLAARHGALALLVSSLWVWAVVLYALCGAALCRLSMRRGVVGSTKPRAPTSDMIKAAMRADAAQRKHEGAQ